jgi:hypothetical protein
LPTFRRGQTKEVVIPALSTSAEGEEKDAYLFITRKTNKEGRPFYLIETNIPIGSIYAKTYDGYVMKRDLGFYVNEVPAEWTAVMNIVYENDIVLYRGMAYPSKSAPLIYTGTSFGSDVFMKDIISGRYSLAETGKGLLDKITEVITKTEIQTREQEDSMNYLVKCGNLSASVYSYIDSKFEEVYEY